MAKHFIITNREVNGTFPNEVIRSDGKEKADYLLRYGTYEFDEKKETDEGKVQLFEDVFFDSRGFQASVSANSFKGQRGSTQMMGELFSLMKSAGSTKGDTLVFIHGFNSDLKNNLKTIRRLHKEYVQPKDSPVSNIVLFSWPARSELLRYPSDQEDSIVSGMALGRAFKRLVDFFRDLYNTEGDSIACNRKIHLLCHSMGNQVLQGMMRYLIEQNSPYLKTVFEEIILAAADVEYDLFEEGKPFHRLINLGERIHIYHHKHDMALVVSERLKNSGSTRLGRVGVRKTSELPDDVFEINVTGITDDNEGIDDRTIHHWYYYSSDSVVKDIRRVLKGGDSKLL